MHEAVKRTSEFRFYEELNDFLPPDRRKISFTYDFTGTPSVKDAIEAIGVPHTEVDLILIDGRSVGFEERLHGGERVAVYPVFERLDVTPLTHLRPRPLRVSEFVVDRHLGKLARNLRMLGFDAETPEGDLIAIARDERRIILTRDRRLLRHGDVTHGYWVRSTDPAEQIREVVNAFDLASQFKPFSRCLECNVDLESVSAEHLAGRVPADVLENFDSFTRCPDCERIFWQGSHFERMLGLVQSLTSL